MCELLNNTLSSNARKRIKLWLLAVLFLIGICLAGMDSPDFNLFVLTKILAVLMLLVVYAEGKSLWEQREAVSMRDGYMGKPLKGSHKGALLVFEKRKSLPCSYSFRKLDRNEKADMVGRLVFPRVK